MLEPRVAWEEFKARAMKAKEQGDLQTAAEQYEKAVNVVRSAAQREPPLGIMLNYLAGLYRALGRSGDAAKTIVEAIKIDERPDTPPIVLGNDLMMYGRILQDQRKNSEALTVMLRALRIFEAEYGQSHRLVSQIRGQIASIGPERERS